MEKKQPTMSKGKGKCRKCRSEGKKRNRKVDRREVLSKLSCLPITKRPNRKLNGSDDERLMDVGNQETT